LQSPCEEEKSQSNARGCAHATKWPIFAPIMHRPQGFYSGPQAVVFAANFRSATATSHCLIAERHMKVAKQLYIFHFHKKNCPIQGFCACTRSARRRPVFPTCICCPIDCTAMRRKCATPRTNTGPRGPRSATPRIGSTSSGHKPGTTVLLGIGVTKVTRAPA
jgi:hypothetical protein